MRHVLAGLGATILLGLPTAAWATCNTSCKATLQSASCSEPTPPDEWPAVQPLRFAAACETCCAPPGGPAKCDAAALDPKKVKVLAGATPVAGEVTPTGTACDDEAMFLFTGKLQPGAHSLVFGNLILVTFQVTGKPGCATDADCSGCTNCETGQCLPLTCTNLCKTDKDCAKGGLCVVTEPGCCSECQLASVDAASADAGDVAGAGGKDAAAGPADTGATLPDAGAAVADAGAALADAGAALPDGGAAVPDATKPAAPAAPATPAAKSGGCSAADPAVPRTPVFWVPLLALAVAVRLRRRAS